MPKTRHEPLGCLIAILRLFGIDFGQGRDREVPPSYQSWGQPQPPVEQSFYSDQPDCDEPLPYRLRDDFLSPAEQSFYHVLVTAVGSQAVVCPKVNLADVFYVVQPNRNQAYRNKIDRKHVDFLVCDAATMVPRLGIELDDASHGRRDRQDRDEFVAAVFEEACLPLARFPARMGYNLNQLRSEIASHLDQTATLTPPSLPVDETAPDSGPPICPKCGIPMVLRTASKGPQAGQQFFGCRNYPRCREIRPC